MNAPASRPSKLPPGGRLWTDVEDELLRKHYLERGPAWCAEQLHRTEASVCKRAEKFKLYRHSRRWTPEEDAILRREWGEVGERRLRAILPGRRSPAIARRAEVIGLEDAAQGLETVTAAMKRVGMNRRQFLRVITEAGVRVKLRVRGSGKRATNRGLYRWRCVRPDDVTAAVEAWLARGRATLTCPEAADRCGVSETTMRRALLALAAERSVDGMPQGRPWFVSPADANEALALYRSRLVGRWPARRDGGAA